MKLKSTIWMGILIFGMGNLANASIRELLPRSVTCNGFPKAVSVELSLVTQENLVTFDGGAADNYTSVTFKGCTTEGEGIRCSGKWSFHELPAALDISQLADGTFRGKLTDIGGRTIVLGCLLSYDPLRN